MKKLKQKEGITLIALIITIIVLLILAGVTIGMLTGENSILRNANLAANKYSEETAREKLEVKLVEMFMEKLTNSEYNQDEYLTQELINEGFGVSGDVVIVDEWQFLIDRSIPRIVASLGKGVKNEGIQIELSQEVSGDYTKSTITIKVTPMEEINSILLNGEEVIDLIQEDGTITKEVTENGTYSVIAKNTKDNYNMKSITVTELTVDMDIWNKEDLISFREKVNEGRTYEGRTVRVMADINLNEEKYTIGEGGAVTFNPDAEQWTPIGNYGEDTTLRFKGTLEGNKHTIKGLYIENDKNFQGLFGRNEGGTIKELTIEEGYIKGTAANSTTTESGLYSGSAYIGAIAGENSGGQIINCTNKIKIEGNAHTAGIAGYSIIFEDKEGKILNCTNEGEIISIGNGTNKYVAGITAVNQGIVDNCINRGKITTENTTASYNFLAGIVSNNAATGKITNCTNYGEITHKGSATAGVFVAGIVSNTNGEIINCINEGKITNNATTNTSSGYAYTGGIAAGANDNAPIKDCRNIAEIVSSASGAVVQSGGIAGRNAYNIENCNNTGNVLATGTADRGNYAAGIVSANVGKINNCSNTGNITSTASGLRVHIGGITGLSQTSSGQIINCANIGVVINNGKNTSTTGNLISGGITGVTETGANFLNCYNRGEVKCSGTGASYVGGIAGITDSGKIDLCYNTGKLTNTATGTKYTGAITGNNSSATITNCYYLSGTATAGIGSGTTTGTTAMSDANMKLETFVNTLNNLRKTGYLEWVKTETYPEIKTN